MRAIETKSTTVPVKQSHRRYTFELFLLALFLATILAMLTFERLSKNTFVVEADVNAYASLTDDALDNGGNSFAEWIDETQQIWRCDLADDYLYYYCLLTYDLTYGSQKDQGIDLSDYQEITLYFDYQSDHDDTLRLELRNFNPDFSTVGDTISLKYNEYEFRPSEYGQSITIKLSDFHVANWWLIERRIPNHLSAPNFDNVTQIQIQTGSKDAVGEKIIQIKRIVFTGQTISAETYYLVIIIVWLICLTALGLIRSVQIVKELRQERLQRETLVRENKKLERLKTELEQRVHVDDLTNVLNRAGIESAFSIMHFNWSEQSIRYGLIVIDIDHFKKINDQHGHQVGDQVLKRLGSLLASTIRSDDVIGRWGGEEFVILAAVDAHELLNRLAEKVRLAIENESWPNAISVTASLGIALVSVEDTIDSIFSRADTQLYQAKLKGRNRVVG